MTAPTKWFASPADTPHGTASYDRVAVGAGDVLAMFADAELIRVQRVTGDATNSPPLRIFVEDPAVLLNDPEHGDAINALATMFARYGLESGVRIELQW